MRGIRFLAGALVSWGIVMSGVAQAGDSIECPSAAMTATLEESNRSAPSSGSMTSTLEESNRSAPSSANGEVVVVITAKEGHVAGTEIRVTGGPSQGVRIVAPSDVTATAVGGAGAAGTPGEAGAAK